jgi:hypothetical protein
MLNIEIPTQKNIFGMINKGLKTINNIISTESSIRSRADMVL